MNTPQIANPQIFRLITLSQNRINHENRLGERLQIRTCQANRPPITILLVALQRLCRTHARIRRQVRSAGIYDRLAKLVLCLVLAYMQWVPA
jgi:hypothetical protein